MDNRITVDELTQEELAEIRERSDKYEEQDKPLYRTRFRKEDIDFVDNAREDIPKLLAEIERLHEEIDEKDEEIQMYVEIEWGDDW